MKQPNIVESEIAPAFRFLSSYMGASTYEVEDATGRYTAEIRYEACDYHRSIFNGSAERFEREIVGAIGTIHRRGDIGVAIPSETIAAFNAMQLREHTECIRRVDSDPSLRAVVSETDPLRRPPTVLVGATWCHRRQEWIRHM